MNKYFKILNSINKVDVIEYIAEKLAENPYTKVYIGCDSQNYGGFTHYSTVIVLRYNKNGGHVIYKKDNILIRSQIKLIGYNNVLPVRKIKVNSKTNTKIYNYTKDDIDEFIGVDLKENKIYIIPIDFINKYKSTISLNIIKQNFMSI